MVPPGSAPSARFGSGRRHARHTVLAVDGPTPLEMVRAVPAIRRDPLAYLAGVVARHGDLVAFPMPRTPVLLVNEPSVARHVLQNHHGAYSKQTIQYAALSAVTGNGLLTSDGEAWQARRRLVRPALHGASLDRVAEESVAAAHRLSELWLPAGAGRPGGVAAEARRPGGVAAGTRRPGGVAAGRKRPQGVASGGATPVAVDLDGGVRAATLEVLARTLFAAGLSLDGRRVASAVDDALRVVVARAQSPLPASWPTPSRRRLRRAVAILDDVSRELVGRRRAAGPAPEDGDLLGLLLRRAADSGELSEADIRNELITFVIAGHETVAACLSWTLHLLAGHPPAQERARRELDEVLAGREPTRADLPRLVYLRACVDESLRLFPPAWVLTRRARQPDEVGGLQIPAGTLLIISPWLLHRRAASWPDPTRFDPLRFLGDLPATRAGAYLPFGAGPRLCVGREFALVEAVLMLATLLRRLRVAPSPGARAARAEALVTLRPQGGLRLLVTAR